MDLIHFVVKDGVLNSVDSGLPSGQKEDLDADRGTVYACMRHLQHHLEMSQVTIGNLSMVVSL